MEIASVAIDNAVVQRATVYAAATAVRQIAEDSATEKRARICTAAGASSDAGNISRQEAIIQGASIRSADVYQSVVSDKKAIIERP